MKTIVIGDIHGCYEEFQAILEAAELQEDDRLVLLGDLIDRGPDPAAVVAFARDVHAECVMGNHEEKALRWRRHEKRRKDDPTHYKNPMRSIDEKRLAQWAKISDELWDWVATWPPWKLLDGNILAVHAGCMPHVEIEKQMPNELMRLRYVKSIGQPSGYLKYKMASLNEAGEVEAANEFKGEAINHWTELWAGPEHVVYGHYVWDEIHETTTENGVKTWGIDTGCVHGGKLTALIIEETGETRIVQVPALQTYVERRPWTDSME